DLRIRGEHVRGVDVVNDPGEGRAGPLRAVESVDGHRVGTGAVNVDGAVDKAAAIDRQAGRQGVVAVRVQVIESQAVAAGALAEIAGAVARPLRSVTSRTLRMGTPPPSLGPNSSPPSSPPRDNPRNEPLAPVSGAVNVTGTPATGLPSASVTFTCRGVA